MDRCSGGMVASRAERGGSCDGETPGASGVADGGTTSAFGATAAGLGVHLQRAARRFDLRRRRFRPSFPRLGSARGAGLSRPPRLFRLPPVSLRPSAATLVSLRFSKRRAWAVQPSPRAWAFRLSQAPPSTRADSQMEPFVPFRREEAQRRAELRRAEARRRAASARPSIPARASALPAAAWALPARASEAPRSVSLRRSLSPGLVSTRTPSARRHVRQRPLASPPLRTLAPQALPTRGARSSAAPTCRRWAARKSPGHAPEWAGL